MSVSKTAATPKTHRRISITDILARKADTTPVVCLTAYTALTAKLLEDNVDLLLVGDSLGMVIYGMETTVGVTVEMMIAHGAAVVRGSTKPCIVVDLPFGSYQESPGAAFRTAARVMAETGCNAIKLEGGREMAETVKFLVERGIPVMGHIGLTPQHIHRFGGFRAQARTEAEALALVADALAIAEAGAFSIVIEAVPESSARLVTEQVQVPVIGIGAGQAVDGQILVTEDIAGLFIDFKPRFVKRYGELGAGIAEAARLYADEVRTGAFPGPEHTFAAKRE
jgi:3-methyl-2-oxobutanoate hydroxymethyltransferase